MKRHVVNVPVILAIVLNLLAVGVLQTSTPRLASAQDEVEQPDGPAEPAASLLERDPRGPDFVPGQLLVHFRENLPPGHAATALADEGTVPVKYLPALEVYVLRLPPGLTVEKAAEVFSRRIDVEYAEPNYILHVADTLRTWRDTQWAPQKIKATEAWAAGQYPAQPTIAIVDTGVDYGHSQLAPNVLAGRGYDFYNGDADPMDDNGHGTHVAGIAAATVGASTDGMAGICPFCKLLPVKVLGAGGSGSLDIVATGITYAADEEARVINLSLGGTAGTATLQSAVDYAWNHGAVVVAAAGNDGANVVLYPAAYANSMAVAATDKDDNHSCFSSYGNATAPYVTVAAPGEAIYSTIPRIDNQDAYAIYSGTSMATPHVAGLAGLLFAQDSDRTNATVRDLIQSTTEDLGPLGSDPFFGTGRINALRAVTNNRSPTPPPTQPDRVFSDQLTASGYAHARKLVRDGVNLHMVWHTQEGGRYLVRYATSQNNGANWTQSEVYSSTLETYHPAIAIGPAGLYVAFPSRSPEPGFYQVLFTSKPLSGGEWATPTAVIGGSYHAVRPDIFYDTTNGQVHVVASSLDDRPYVYHRSLDAAGGAWSDVHSVNPSTSTTASNTRYATVYANGANVYIAARTLSQSFFTTYYLHTVRSMNGGADWFDQFKVSSYVAFLSGEYGVSLAGVGDRLYMGYEVGGGLYFRKWQTDAWSNYVQLETAGAWPSITQAADGQAWLMWENAGSLLLRHYDGSNWEPATTLLAASSFDKRRYPNLRLNPEASQVEWLSTSCRGGPFSVLYGTLPVGNQPPTISDIADLAVDEDSSTSALQFVVGDAETPAGSLALSSSSSNTALVPGANIVFDGSDANRTVTVAPAANQSGTTTISITVTDGAGATAVDTFELTVNPVNDAPVANPQAVVTQQGVAVAITLSGSDVEGSPLTYAVATPPAHGGLSGVAPSLTYTPAAGYSGSDSFTFRVNDGAADSAPAPISITINPVVTGPRLYIGSSKSGVAGTVAFADEDILIKDIATGAWTMFIEGSDIGLTDTDVDAFELTADGWVLMSFDTAFVLSSFGQVDDSDILRFVPTSTGDVTAGSWEWYFDGSDVGLSTNDEDVDAFTLLQDGRLLISTLGNAGVTGASGADEDLLAFTPSALGGTTAGTWAMYFDGSDVGLSTTSNEDVNGVWVDAAGKIYLTTLGAFSVTGASGDGSDLFVCTPGSLGATTSCTWTKYWDGSDNGFSGQDTDSFSRIP